MRETVQLIEQYYEFFNTGNMSAFLELLDGNIIHDINPGNRVG